MCSWQLVWRNSNYLFESPRDSPGVLPIIQQKVNASQSSFRLIQIVHFSLLFMLYIGVKMMQINNKKQKWKYKASILNNTATLVFWVCILVMAKPKLDTYKLWQNHNLIYPSYGNTITCRYPLSSMRLTDSPLWVSMIPKLEKLRESETWIPHLLPKNLYLPETNSCISYVSGIFRKIW